jgi:glycosyltransferase involved in cell wall biosynthesis
MTSTDLRISVVVCAYTEARWDELVACIGSLRTQSRPADELVLVIDHATGLYVRAAAAFPDVCVVESDGPQGLSGARNTGLARSTGDVVAFIDEDAMADREWLAALAPHFDDADVLGAGGTISPRWMTGKPWWFPDEFLWVVGCTYRGMPTSAAPVRNLIGCNMSIRRSVVERAGGFRIGRVGALSIGLENDETEMCIRARATHPTGRFVYDPAVRVVNHRVPAGRAATVYFLKRCFSEGISKARLSGQVGADDGLANERAYVRRTLPLGVLRGIGDVLRGHPSGIGRSLAIVVGFTATVVGFVVGTTMRDPHATTTATALAAR